MSAAIDSVTISSIEDHRLVLGNHQIAAPILIAGVQSNAWVRIRLALRYSVDDFGMSPTTPDFYLGVMSNPAVDGSGFLNNGPLDASTSHFVGMRPGSAWARSTTILTNYTLTATNAWLGTTRIGSTTTNGNTLNTASAQRISADTATKRGVVVLEITKGGSATTWTMRHLTEIASGAASNVFTDITLANLRTALAISDLATVATSLGAGTGEYVAGSVTTMSGLNINEGTNGNLNALVVAWDRGSGNTSFKIRISDFLYVLFPS